MTAVVAGQTLVVAGLWVRAMAQSARRAGWNVIGLDLFGDRDTRAACVEWRRIGDAAAMTIARAQLREALNAAASHPGVIGCVLGSGFEGRPELVADVRSRLELIGMDTSRVAAVRDPERWFGVLDELGLEHPAVVFGDVVPDVPDTRHTRGARDTCDAGPLGWLVKNAHGSGGWHIREARPGDPLAQGEYLQRRVEGRSISALFLADGMRALIVGISAQDVRPLGTLPFVYQGAIGPVRDDATAARLERGLDALVPALGLVGLASADVLATPHGLSWLEINPRPSATMLLYDHAWPQGLMHAHVHACRGRLPDVAPAIDAIAGHRVVFAAHAITIDAAIADALARHSWCHDVPMPGTLIGAGEPLCSVSAYAAGEQALLDELERRVIELSSAQR